MPASAALLCGAVFVFYAAIAPYIAVLIRSLNFSPSMTGLILGASEIAAIVVPFFCGAHADKSGNYKTTFLAVLLLSVLSAAALFLVKNPLVCAFFVPLLAAGYRSTIPLSDAVITVNLGREGNYGKVRAAGSLFYVVMVLVLQITPVFRPATAPNIAFWSLASAVLVVIVLFALPAPFLKPAKRASAAPDSPAAGKKGLVWTPVFITGLTLIFLNRLAFSPVQTYLSLYTTEYLRWDAVGLVSAISAFSEMPFIFLSNKIIKRFGALPLIVVTTAVIMARLLLLALFPGKITLVLTQLLHSLTFGVFHPAAVAFIALHVPPRNRAAGMAVYMSLGTGLPAFIGNIIGGFVIEHFGYRALFGSFAVFALAAVLLYLVLKRRLPTRWV